MKRLTDCERTRKHRGKISSKKKFDAPFTKHAGKACHGDLAFMMALVMPLLATVFYVLLARVSSFFHLSRVVELVSRPALSQLDLVLDAGELLMR